MKAVAATAGAAADSGAVSAMRSGVMSDSFSGGDAIIRPSSQTCASRAIAMTHCGKACRRFAPIMPRAPAKAGGTEASGGGSKRHGTDTLRRDTCASIDRLKERT
ncbi:hypothetical protein GCM10023307_17110 [Lysobacter hankyongensis]|uniref:Uncharacterized protein n=1 Tax=Lysobacter hankyongensis TaxID=1176535 RepID=A0ABP9BAQ9_9GAMM